MKKTGFLIFAIALIVGIVVAKFTSFGAGAFTSPANFIFGTKLHGSGNVVSQTRDTGSFEGIEVGGNLVVEVARADKTSVIVQTDDNIAPLIKTEVSGGTLKIWSESKFKTSKGVLIRITAPAIEEIDTSGVASLTMAGFENDSLDLSASGASKIKATGSAKNVSIDMSGASRIDASKLSAANAVVDGNGASGAEVYASTSLEIDLSGASNVTYSGTPANFKKSVSGASSVNAAK